MRWIVTGVSAAASATSWLAIDAVVDQQEAWDTGLYWPTMIALALALGVIFRSQFRWIGIGMAAAQLLTLFATQPVASTFGAGVVLLIQLGLFWTGCAWVSGQVTRVAVRCLGVRFAR